MKKKAVILLAVVVIVAAVAIIMVIRHNNNPEVQLEKANKEIQDAMKEERYLSDSELNEILKNTGKILLSQVNYDFTSEMYNFEKKEFEPWLSGHVWSSGTNFRRDTQGFKTIVNKGIIYFGKDKFRRGPMHYSEESTISAAYGIAMESSSVEIIMFLLNTSVLEKENVKYFKEEKVDDKDTVVIGGNCIIYQKNYEVKLWIWKEKGIVVKSEIISKPDPSMSHFVEPSRTIYKFKNISFEEFDKSVFNVSEKKLFSEIKDDVFKDSDSDGLIDYVEENIFNTDPNNPDSDGDGYKDGDEIKNAYDPNGDGRLFGEFQ